jgi:hypothetical protein
MVMIHRNKVLEFRWFSIVNPMKIVRIAIGMSYLTHPKRKRILLLTMINTIA